MAFYRLKVSLTFPTVLRATEHSQQMNLFTDVFSMSLNEVVEGTTYSEQRWFPEIADGVQYAEQMMASLGQSGGPTGTVRIHRCTHDEVKVVNCMTNEILEWTG